MAEQPPGENPIGLDNCSRIVSNLYLGGITAALETQTLVEQGIRAVVCCVRESEFPSSMFHKELAYYRVDVEDMSCEPIELFWSEAILFVHDWLSKGHSVLVHCRAGVSRSASTVLAYLVAYQNYSLNDAFVVARSRRPVVTPNLGFMEKLCEFEASTRLTLPTVDLRKYESWYSGLHVGGVPDVGTVPKPTTALPVEFKQIGSRCDSNSLPSRLKIAARKSMIIKHLSNTEHKQEIDLDLPPSFGNPVAQERIETIRAILLRQAAQDAEVGYCEGMHFFAVAFAASSHSQGEASWRFHAFMGLVRGLWLPGLPLVRDGLCTFVEAAQQRGWFLHLRAHRVEPTMYLPRAWLTLFRTWLPFRTLTACLELLEGHGFAGILATTLALMDHAEDRLLKCQSTADLLHEVDGMQETAPDPSALSSAMRAWLPRVTRVQAQSRVEQGIDLPLDRQGSRIVGDLGSDTLCSEQLLPLMLESDEDADDLGFPIKTEVSRASIKICDQHEEIARRRDSSSTLADFGEDSRGLSDLAGRIRPLPWSEYEH